MNMDDLTRSFSFIKLDKLSEAFSPAIDARGICTAVLYRSQEDMLQRWQLNQGTRR